MTAKLLSKILSSVVGIPVIYSHQDGAELFYSTKDHTYTGLSCINIYELAHKCKEIIFNFYNLDIVVYRNNNGFLGHIYELKTTWDDNIYTSTYANTEPDAIFLCYEWIFTSYDSLFYTPKEKVK